MGAHALLTRYNSVGVCSYKLCVRSLPKQRRAFDPKMRMVQNTHGIDIAYSVDSYILRALIARVKKIQVNAF